MEEHTVDENLEAHLNNPLTENEGQGDMAIEDDEFAVDEEEVDKPITNQQKEYIYSLFAELGSTIDHKWYADVGAVRNLDSKNAAHMIETLEALKAHQFSINASQKILAKLTATLKHPLDYRIEEEVKADKMLNMEFNTLIGKFFSYFGPYKAGVIFGLYIYSSWTTNWRNEAARDHINNTNQTGGNAPPPVQRASSKQIPVRKDNIDD
jgi:hypothetical protein